MSKAFKLLKEHVGSLKNELAIQVERNNKLTRSNAHFRDVIRRLKLVAGSYQELTTHPPGVASALLREVLMNYRDKVMMDAAKDGPDS